jgi:hypothetical protein
MSDRQIYTAIQANGTVKDIGGVLQYFNMKKRMNYGFGIEHVPYLTGGVGIQDTLIHTSQGDVLGTNINYIFERIYYDQAGVFTQYPFSSTKRFEFSASASRLGFETMIQKYVYVGDILVDQFQENAASIYKPINSFEPSVALVGDNSFSAFTSPVAGGRYRFSYAPTVGTLTYQTALFDYRKYLFMRPVSLAVRAYHLGRYGKDAQNSTGFLPPLYLGEETWIRGYGWGSFSGTECQPEGTGPAAANRCPAIERLFGSRVALANIEFRIPLFGTSDFGLFNLPFLPTEISPFFDAGVAYTPDQPVKFELARSANTIPTTCASQTNAVGQTVNYYGCAERIPVFSTGFSMRFNLFGYAIMEAYLAHPFQRPQKPWVWGFQLAPGW